MTRTAVMALAVPAAVPTMVLVFVGGQQKCNEEVAETGYVTLRAQIR
jgi:hypothetical protein